LVFLNQFLNERDDIMAKGKNTAEVLDNDDELDFTELADNQYQERTLVLKAAPPSRRAQLLAHGAIEIRCLCCGQIRPLAKAEEYEEGWVCKACVPKIA
jgi:hypothetical protein